ncbi:DUF427 domain-containing protein [Arachidicoccus terrestris]|uniref:DUF427 domain-containing protein n=1 Tax=Arachidicoccus terrestris TaxID=2875539 RepID=UPI001CC8242F|nr:DUF427 domain-containing protein [Arachidicoccus terrestris]UAY56000.1 DUF427 domain-containing protein [Arachidicoccus terrestris]
MRAVFNGQVIAESNDTLVVEGNHYFPPESVNMGFLGKSNTHTTCPWKGVASYYDVKVNGRTAEDGAWYYASPKPLAEAIKGYIAFWHGVEVVH